MATWSRRTVVSRRHEWIVPAREPWGAMLGDLRSALTTAELAYRTHVRVSEDDSRPLPDDAMQIKVGDEELIISFVVEEVLE